MKHRPFRPALESLESRLTPASISVLVQLTQDSIVVQRGTDPVQTLPRSGTTDILGTADDEHYEIRLAPGAFTDLRIHGGGGDDSVAVFTSDEKDAIAIGPGTGSVIADSYALALVDFGPIQVTGDTADVAKLTGSPKSDFFVSTEDYAYLQGDGFFNVIVGAGEVRVAGNGGQDRAYLYDTSANDFFVLTENYAYLKNNTQFVQIDASFTSEQFSSTIGGSDTVWIYGSSSPDQFMFNSYYATLTNSKYQQLIGSFETVEARLQTGDSAALYGTSGTEILTLYGSYTRLANWNRLYVLGIAGQSSLAIQGGGGTDLVNVAPNTYAGIQAKGFRTVNQLALTGTYLEKTRKLAMLVDPTLAQATSKLDLAIRLRNFVYQNASHGVTSPSFLQYNAFDRDVVSLIFQQESVICGGSSILYSELLSAFGISSQLVLLFASNQVDGHVTTEVTIDGKKIVLDSTFNVAFLSEDGVYLGIDEMKTRSAASDPTSQVQPWIIDHGGFPLKYDNNRVSIEQYYLPFQAFFASISYQSGVTPNLGALLKARRI